MGALVLLGIAMASSVLPRGEIGACNVNISIGEDLHLQSTKNAAFSRDSSFKGFNINGGAAGRLIDLLVNLIALPPLMTVFMVIS